MPTNRETAEAIVRAYVEGAATGRRIFWSYGDIATLIGRKGQSNLLGGPLDEVRLICDERGWPDIGSVIVTKPSLLDGTLTPSEPALAKYGGMGDLRRVQARVISFDWSTVR
jgi:hypothetical protein